MAGGNKCLILLPPKRRKFIDADTGMFYVCSGAELLREKAECPVPSKPFRLAPLATDWYIAAWRAARLTKAGREEPGLLNRGVSVAGVRSRKGLTAKRARPETRKWRRNDLKRFNLRRENGMALASNMWGAGRNAVPKNCRRLSPDGRGHERRVRRMSRSRNRMSPANGAVGRASSGAEPDRPGSSQCLNERRTFDVPDAFGYAYARISGEAP